MAEATFTQLVPTQFAADLVVAIGDPPRLGIVVEVQLREDEAKRYTWPLYAVALRARWRCPVVVLVYAPELAVLSALAHRLGPRQRAGRGGHDTGHPRGARCVARGTRHALQ